MLARRIGLAALGLCAVFAAITFFAERDRVGEVVIDRALVAASRFNTQAQALLDRGIVMVDTEDPICAAASLLSMEDFMMILPMGFNAEAAGETRATLQFNFEGDVQGACHFDIRDGKIEAKKGPAENASMTINSPFELWVDIMAGKADGQQMFMEQKYTVDGDLNLLLRMDEFFGK